MYLVYFGPLAVNFHCYHLCSPFIQYRPKYNFHVSLTPDEIILAFSFLFWFLLLSHWSSIHMIFLFQVTDICLSLADRAIYKSKFFTKKDQQKSTSTWKYSWYHKWSWLKINTKKISFYPTNMTLIKKTSKCG